VPSGDKFMGSAALGRFFRKQFGDASAVDHDVLREYRIPQLYDLREDACELGRPCVHLSIRLPRELDSSVVFFA